MIYRIYGQKDSTIYEQDALRAQNAGGDEILEVTKFYDTLTDSILIGNSRVLTQFDISTISASISAGTTSSVIPASPSICARLGEPLASTNFVFDELVKAFGLTIPATSAC